MSYAKPWRQRWYELTGVMPDKSLAPQRKINGSAVHSSCTTLRDDAISKRSRQFRKNRTC